MKVLTVSDRRGKAMMEFTSFPDPEPSENELLVEIEATALNRADLMQKEGTYPPPPGASPILGLEMSGTVVKTGSRVDRFRQGDRVMGLLSGGGYAEYCCLHEEMAMKIPESLSFEEAAAIPEVFLTAWQALSWLGELQEKDPVLIHAGASGVGSAAIQMAKTLFASPVITTAGSEKKLKACKDLGADIPINYRTDDFVSVIEKKRGKNSVRLVIDVVGAPYWEQNLQVLSLDGRLVLLAMMGGVKTELNLIPLLRKRLTVKGSTLRNRPEDYKKELTSDFGSRVLPLFDQNRLHPVIDSLFSWEEVEQAHQRMGSNQNTGKIILTGM